MQEKNPIVVRDIHGCGIRDLDVRELAMVAQCAHIQAISLRILEPAMPNTRPRKSPGRTRRARNLSLSDEAVERGERYSASVGLSLSALVDQMLRALPSEQNPGEDELPPKLRQLREVLVRDGPPIDWREEYREHVANKFVREGRKK